MPLTGSLGWLVLYVGMEEAIPHEDFPDEGVVQTSW